jgi:hypothetical protein
MQSRFPDDSSALNKRPAAKKLISSAAIAMIPNQPDVGRGKVPNPLNKTFPTAVRSGSEKIYGGHYL